MGEPPHVTADLPGVGGRIKTAPADFVVVERPLYEPAGEGAHVYVELTREGRTTRELQRELARVLGVGERAVGYAGLKDKNARATQTFSIELPAGDLAEVGRRIAGELGVEVGPVRRHANKLRRGHLLGNRFAVCIRGVGPGAAARAVAVCRALERRGLPNFYGEQRFGGDGANASRGRAILAGAREGRRFLRDLYLSAWQSSLFDRWLAERMERGGLEILLPGDLAKKLDTGGLFLVADAATEQPRLDRQEITHTGPMFGTRMRWAEAEAGHIEHELLEAEGVGEAELRRARLSGSRRPARLRVESVAVAEEGDAIRLEFELPKGAYATTLLREVMKPSGGAPMKRP